MFKIVKEILKGLAKFFCIPFFMWKEKGTEK